MEGAGFEFDEVQDPVLAYLHTPHKEEVTAKTFPCSRVVSQAQSLFLIKKKKKKTFHD